MLTILRPQIDVVRLLGHSASAELSFELIKIAGQLPSLISVAGAEIKIPEAFNLRLMDRVLEDRVQRGNIVAHGS